MMQWRDIAAGTSIEPASISLSVTANARYCHAAGFGPGAVGGDLAYPLVAANATVLAWLATCDIAMIQTRQHLRCHRAATTPIELVTSGSVVERSERRGRTYVTVRVEIRESDQLLWTSEVDFTPAESVTRPNPDTTARIADRRNAPNRLKARGRLDPSGRTFTITDELIGQYSRRGNYHSEPEAAAALGLPGLVAQGTQVCGPAYAQLLDAWGEEFVARGALDLKFLGMVLGGDTVEARVAFDGARERADIEIWNLTRDRVAAVGRAQRC
jgi:acyl dehydratase